MKCPLLDNKINQGNMYFSIKYLMERSMCRWTLKWTKMTAKHRMTSIPFNK